MTDTRDNLEDSLRAAAVCRTLWYLDYPDLLPQGHNYRRWLERSVAALRDENTRLQIENEVIKERARRP